MTVNKAPISTTLLQSSCHQFSELSHLSNNINSLSDCSQYLAYYDLVYPLLEQQLWDCSDDSHQLFTQRLTHYQQLFKEQEQVIAQLKSDNRHNFILSITIADRPEHLKACLESIFQLCEQFAYGGKENGFYKKVCVIVVEDSKEASHIDEDIKLADDYVKKGLRTFHYGQKEQADLMLQINSDDLSAVESLIGKASFTDFYHKGQAVTRNLSYLKAIQLSHHKKLFNQEPVLYYLVDSDQLFHVNLPTHEGDKAVTALNYFYYINKIFNEKQVTMLTGKLVGDPPVSPSVMAVNFIDDIMAFLMQLSNYQPQDECQFHPHKRIKPSDAAYHDMSQLFGLKSETSHYDYNCTLSNTTLSEDASLQHKHSNLDCLTHFTQHLNNFFYGEHLTRKTYFSYSGELTKTQPARTIYPGNYIVNEEGLKYIIPFGQLRLRMSGPTAGRLIQAEIGESFSSVNLPMLHNRTIATDLSKEFRPGVSDKDRHELIKNIDLSDEFERQFFGDLMLFSVVKLSEKQLQFSQENIFNIINTVEKELLTLYQQKHKDINKKSTQLLSFINESSHWWNKNSLENKSMILSQLQQFIKNIDVNFGSKSEAYQLIQSKNHRENRKKIIIDALLEYKNDRQSWDKLINKLTSNLY